jgi:type IV pilus assembly protein PilV
MRRLQRGFSFIEALCASALLAIGIVGFSAMQVRSLEIVRGAHTQAMAMALAADITDRIHANVSGTHQASVNETTALQNYLNAAWSGPYNCATTPAALVPCSAESTGTDLCTQSSMASFDVYDSYCQATASLPNPSLSFAKCSSAGGNTYCAYVAWFGEPATAANCSAYDSHCVSMEMVP